MKVIFLDVDGVLNSYKYGEIPYMSRDEGYRFLDKQAFKYVKMLVVQSGAVLVLSSTWRYSFHKDLSSDDDMARGLIQALQVEGLSLYDITPQIDMNRYEEIKEWLKQHPEVDKYVILDDSDYDWKDMGEVWIACNSQVGLTKKDVRKAIQILK